MRCEILPATAMLSGDHSCIDGDCGCTLGDVRRHSSDGQVGDYVWFAGGTRQAGSICPVGGVPCSQLAVGAGRLRLAAHGK